MEFNTRDRLAVNSFMVDSADIDALLLQRSIRNKIEITKKEFKDLGLEMKPISDSQFLWGWDDEKEQILKVDLTPKEIGYLEVRMTALNTEKKLTEQNLDFAIKIKEAANTPIVEAE